MNMNALTDSASQKEIRRVWEDAVASFSALKDDGKLGAELWAVLVQHSDPASLLKSLQKSPHLAQPGQNKLLHLAEGCIDAVRRFDTEIAMVMQGVSNYTLGVSCILWGGLGFVLHVSQDIFKTPEVITETISKIFIMMPRIDVYFDLFRDGKDTLDLKPLLVDIYKGIVKFNVECANWYGSLRFKALKLFREDPRISFRDIFDRMTDAGEEMRKRAEALAWKHQQATQKDLVNRLVRLELDHQERIEELRDVLLKKYQDESNLQLEKLKEQLDVRRTEEERLRIEQAAKEVQKNENSRKEMKASLGPFLKGSDLRESFWRILHGKPWVVVTESQLNVPAEQTPGSDLSPWVYWNKGVYEMDYPVDGSLANCFLVINWRAESDPDKPELSWIIDTPDSLYYPGKHTGRIELTETFGAKSPSSVVDSRLKIIWKSGIFSAIPQPASGALSSVGPLESTAAPFIFTSTLQSIAYLLITGPFSKPSSKEIFGWHDLNVVIGKYFSPGREDACLRACAFFSNAFTRDVEELQALNHIELLGDYRDGSKMAIRELSEFFGLQPTIAEKIRTDISWDLDASYAEVSTQIEWVYKDRLWAGRIAQLAHLEPIMRASIDSEMPSKLSSRLASVKKPEVKTATSKGSPSKDKGGLFDACEPTFSYTLDSGYGKECLGIDGLPKDWTPLHRAVWHCDVNAVLRLASPSTVDIEDARGWTPLHLACSRSNSLAFNTRQATPRGFAMSLVPKLGMPTFPRRFHESESHAVEMCRVLVEAGADVNAKTPSGNWLPLHNAANTGWLELVHFLLEKGSITFVEDGCSPFCWAKDESALGGQKDEMSQLLKFHLSDKQMELEHVKHSRAFAARSTDT